ncbi:exodeoxyribonuclease VII small subunit [Leuconostoc falkenbergense]|jgi:exodeoxyribonuclease VII small subunit|uniref:Exodeoxyribonuclease 7 small subunit n=1 Tax=Leuconostoc falkenbergense TaxID=2766470 RepID=A0A9X3E9Z7_9LACO|nr:MULTISPECIES: exodeoxyribonuclease VII small subunit [Leuconostoc]KDA48245.1 Exodeoxyribonuclease VII small subunit [Leuconostoc pseudomesenteroides 1159]KDA50159.1 Exodeoxyribonuclease VII small subunit [Leuconostoc pseudomesenteroides PS12]OQJ67943.1 exodeoxyribonuclease VII small subunit [Leuconostoc pseudomesenteroides]MCT4377599.1 exodeoxyribonuclease VII small subunit [Leuconostoc falkenbergense]MCT4389806.1 exodeoxyribonuclease VII small subunit [Leuconostoc falkenbergense]
MSEQLTFEEKLQQLETIVSQLEKGDRPLETALVDFQTGVGLVKDLQKTLKNAEETLAKVMDDNGELSDLELTND